MSKLAIVATIKSVPGKRDEYLAVLKAHGKRCLATEPGTLQFEILVPQEADTIKRLPAARRRGGKATADQRHLFIGRAQRASAGIV
jgi:hypothetical protein